MAQNAIDLKKLQADHPECFEDSKKFKAYLIDLYPEEKKAKINVLSTLLEQGVLKLVKTGSILDGLAFCKQICDDYGFNESIVNECFALFVEIFTLNKSTGAETINEAHSDLIRDYPTLKNYDKTEFEIVDLKLNKYTGRGGNVLIPLGVTLIGDKAFENCDGLMHINIPNSITNIGFAAFNGCSNLTEVMIPDGVKTIENYAFGRCKKLKKVVIPESVTCVKRGAFSMGHLGFYESPDPNCADLTIYCCAKTQPKTWGNDWRAKWFQYNPHYDEYRVYVIHKVVWDYKSE